MKNIEAIKDGKGNIVITEDSFEMLLACLDNQKFVGETPQNGDSLSECRKILHQKYIFETKENRYFLQKRYEHQNRVTSWSGNDVGKVYELFKGTKIKWEKPENLIPLDGSEDIKKGTKPLGKTKDGWIVCKPEPIPWLIERPLRYDYDYLTISEDGKNNRPWKSEEIEKIKKLFNKN